MILTQYTVFLSAPYPLTSISQIGARSLIGKHVIFDTLEDALQYAELKRKTSHFPPPDLKFVKINLSEKESLVSFAKNHVLSVWPKNGYPADYNYEQDHASTQVEAFSVNDMKKRAKKLLDMFSEELDILSGMHHFSCHQSKPTTSELNDFLNNIYSCLQSTSTGMAYDHNPSYCRSTICRHGCNEENKVIHFCGRSQSPPRHFRSGRRRSRFRSQSPPRQFHSGRRRSRSRSQSPTRLLHSPQSPPPSPKRGELKY
jgi:hypothetical protein